MSHFYIVDNVTSNFLKESSMAIHKDGEEVSTRQEAAQEQTYTNNSTPRPNLGRGGKKRIGFGGVVNGVNFLTDSKGSEYTNEIAKTISEVYDKLNDGEVNLSVLVLDKEVDNNSLSYSAIVVSSVEKSNDTVSYYTILLGSTGQKPMTAGEINAEIEGLKNSPAGYKPRIYTIDDAVNGILNEIICAKLAQKYNAKTARPVDGVVVIDVENGVSLKDVANNLAILAYNAIYADELVPTADDDLNIAEAKEDVPTSVFNITTNLSKSPIYNVIGEPVRADWKVNLSLIEGNKQSDVMNSVNPDLDLAGVTGYIEAIPQTDPNISKLYSGTVPPGTPINDIRLRPQIIITDLATRAPTAGFALLSLISSLVMTEKDMYVRALFPTDKKNHVGYLNRITKVNNNDAVLPISDNKYTENDIANAILSMFTLEPVLSLDIQNYGPQSFYTSVFAKAARPLTDKEHENNEKIAAGRYIVELAHNLTDGHFPDNFPADNIFTDQGIIVPIGYYETNNGLRDIRDIDLTFILSKTDNEELGTAWSQSSVLGYSDNFITKTNVISQLCKDAKITGKAIRVTFTNAFLSELANAASRAGFRCKYKTEFTINPTRSINVVSSYFDRAAIADGRQSFLNYQGINRGANYATRFVDDGYRRWGL